MSDIERPRPPIDKAAVLADAASEYVEAPLPADVAELQDLLAHAQRTIEEQRIEITQLRRATHNAMVTAAQERSLRKWRPQSQRKLDRLERKRLNG